MKATKRSKVHDAGLIHRTYGDHDWRRTSIKDSTSTFSDPHGVNQTLRSLDAGARLRREESEREPETISADASVSSSASASDDEEEELEARRERLHDTLDEMLDKAERIVAREGERRSIARDEGKCGRACSIRGETRTGYLVDRIDMKTGIVRGR